MGRFFELERTEYLGVYCSLIYTEFN